MTYLEVVNKVLRRLRENEVASITETPYSTLIADFVNDVKRDIENAWDWEALHNSITVNTTAGTFLYTVTGGNENSRIYQVFNTTDQFPMQYQPKSWFNRIRNLSTVEQNSPFYYSWEVVNTSTRALKFEVYPTPDDVYTITFYGYFPQDELTDGATVVSINGDLLVEGVLARALTERGEAQDYVAQEQKFSNRLSDLIAIEAARRVEDITWTRC